MTWACWCSPARVRPGRRAWTSRNISAGPRRRDFRAYAIRSAKPTPGGSACAGTRRSPSRWSTAGASAAPTARCLPAISPSAPRRRSSACRRSTGASCPAGAPPRWRSSSCRCARRCITRCSVTLSGREAQAAGLVNEALPAARLEERVTEVAQQLLKKNWETLKATKDAVRRVREMTYDNAQDYLIRAQEALNWHDKSDGRHRGMKQFLDDKTYKPGLSEYDKSK